MLELRLYPKFVTFINNDKCLSMVRSKNLKKVVGIKDFDDGLLTADILTENNNIVEEYFDFEDVLRDLHLLKYKDEYFNNIKKESICVKNL